ncbi:hypothetical protein [uncultured Sphaerotilus sp.]|uniref:hypothetical protein n=1 Tax=uncultured Sphaerotilus sp. TaxID=474984 RepID=UPI0030CA4885
MPQLRLLSASIVLALGLSACGGGGDSPTATPDAGTPSASASALNGVLVDDLIVGATIFCDGNDNGVLDAGESSATTDADGKYVFDKACFAPIVSTAGTGYDKSTLKAPKGQYRALAGSAVVSPFTTMRAVSGLTDAEFKAVLAKLGLGGIDVATFDPTKDVARATTAAALAKILNDISEIVTAAGGDSAAAFKAATIAMARHAKSSTGNAFGSDTDLNDLVSAAAEAGLTAGNKNSAGGAIWSAKALANARSLATAGITTLAGNIKRRTSLADALDDLSSGAAVNVVDDTDLEDDTKVAEGRGRAGDAVELGKAQYVSVSGDVVTVAPLSGTATDYTLSQFAAGMSLPGQTLSTLSHVTLPLKATTLALPRQGAVVALALEIENKTTGGLMQGAIDKVVLKRNTDGSVSATIRSDSKVHLYLKTASDVQIGTGATPLEGVGTPLLTNGTDGLGIDLQKLANGMRKQFPDNVSLINKVLTEQGNFAVKVVVNEMDFRHADGTRLGVGKVAVKVPGSDAVARKVSGIAVSGLVTF